MNAIENQLTKRCTTPRDFLTGNNPSRSAMTLIVKDIIDEYGINEKTRKQPIIFYRQYLQWFLLTKLHYKSVRIAELLNRDHSSVLHNRKTVDGLIEINDRHFLEAVKPIEEKLNDVKNLLL